MAYWTWVGKQIWRRREDRALMSRVWLLTDGKLARMSPPALRRRAHRARGATPTPADHRAGITGQHPRPTAAKGRIASPSAGFGSHLAGAGTGGRGDFPPPGGLGPKGHAGGPRQTLIRAFHSEINALSEICLACPIPAPRGAIGSGWLWPPRRERIVSGKGGAETRRKPLRNGRQSRDGGYECEDRFPI